MVLDNVAHDAESVKVSAASVGAEVLLEGDLDGLDVLPRPQRLEDGVRPAERRDVEYDLLAEIVVDPEELRLVKVASGELVEGFKGGGVATEGLLDHQPRETARGRAAVLRNHRGHAPEDGRWHRHEEEAVPGALAGMRGLVGVDGRVEGLV